MKTIFSREFRSYFTSMTGPVFIAVEVLMTGIYFMAYNMGYGYPYFAYTLGTSLFILVITIPILTMRSFSEERKTKTDQLLLTSPVSVADIVIGKYLAMLAVIAIPCVIFAFCPLIIKSTGNAFFAVDYSSLLAFFLIAAAYAAIGMFISALTESVIIAAVAAIAVLLLQNLADGISRFYPSTAAASFIGCAVLATLLVLIIYAVTKNRFLSLILEAAVIIAAVVLFLAKPDVFENLIPDFISSLCFSSLFDRFASNYVFDIKAVIELLSISAAGIFLTTQAIQKRRWS